GLDVFGLQALLALRNRERDLLAFLQRLEAAALDRAEVDEQVVAALRGDEAEALGVVEPLDGAGLTIRHGVTPWIGLRKHGPRHAVPALYRARGNAQRWSGSSGKAVAGPGTCDQPHRSHDVP